MCPKMNSSSIIILLKLMPSLTNIVFKTSLSIHLATNYEKFGNRKENGFHFFSQHTRNPTPSKVYNVHLSKFWSNFFQLKLHIMIKNSKDTGSAFGFSLCRKLYYSNIASFHLSKFDVSYFAE